MQIKLEIFETTMFLRAASPTPLVLFSIVDGFAQSRIRAAWHNVFLLA